MRFLFVNHHANAPEFGNPYRTYYLARELVAAGHSVTIVAAAWSHTRLAQPQVGDDPLWMQVEGVDYCFLPAPAYSMGILSRLKNIFGFLRSYRRARKDIAQRVKPDVVVEATTHILPIYSSRWIARATGAKLIFEARDLWPETLIELSGASRWNPFVLLVGRAQHTALKSADGVISTLVGAERYYRDIGLPPKAFAHIQNGVGIEHFQTAADDDFEALSQIAALREQFPTILGYAGSVGQANALDLLLDAAPALATRGVAVVLVGKGEEKPKLRARAVREGMQNVFFLDAVSKARVVPVIRSFDACYLSGKARQLYRFGTSQNKMFDYMAAARPIFFQIDSPDKIVSTADCGYEVAIPTGEALVTAVDTFLSLTPQERQKMGARGRAYAIDHFTYPVLAQRYLEAVNDMGIRD